MAPYTESERGGGVISDAAGRVWVGTWSVQGCPLVLDTPRTEARLTTWLLLLREFVGSAGFPHRTAQNASNLVRRACEVMRYRLPEPLREEGRCAPRFLEPRIHRPSFSHYWVRGKRNFMSSLQLTHSRVLPKSLIISVLLSCSGVRTIAILRNMDENFRFWKVLILSKGVSIFRSTVFG